MDQKTLVNALEHDKYFSTEIKNILLELDTTNSTSTQVYLNDLLLIIHKRLKNNEIIIDEATKEPMTILSFETWIQNDFTTYSSDMYFNSHR